MGFRPRQARAARTDRAPLARPRDRHLRAGKAHRLDPGAVAAKRRAAVPVARAGGRIRKPHVGLTRRTPISSLLPLVGEGGATRRMRGFSPRTSLGAVCVERYPSPVSPLRGEPPSPTRGERQQELLLVLFLPQQIRREVR